MESNVKVYALSTCGHCRAAKKLLDELGVEPETIDVDLLEEEERRQALDEVRKINPLISFPTIIIGEEVVVGNRENLIRKALGKK